MTAIKAPPPLRRLLAGMTIRNLDALFHPRSVALVGASNQPGSVGAVIARNLLEGGFVGPVMSVNPHETAIRSTLGYRTIADLPRAPDLAVVATPAPTVPRIVADLRELFDAAETLSAGLGNERQAPWGRRQVREAGVQPLRR